MPLRRRYNTANQVHPSVSADGSAGSAQVEQLDNVEGKGETPGTPSTLAPTATAIIQQLRDKITVLEDERNFLREQLKKALDNIPTTSAKRHHSPSSSSSSDSSASDSESSSSPSDGKKSKKAKKKKKKKVSQFGKRMKHPEDVKHRYMFVLKTFKKTHSLNRSCEKLNVDRNTIAYTAVIAEVLLVADSEEKCRVPPFTGGSLLKYAKEVKVFLDDEPELRARIDKKKKERELLPISYKIKGN
ncbi:uncharacterized protein LOC115796083 [Archocentrus centrarchus]|uniref:uncharacterized protein LOC115774119 n=2 Tax=Archocentrus centrarchus TaxID=63155 RepID=UPI0011EA2FE3|nr:uncharacterized protein LOC115774119 [Archocentrus centrarchus]XP_030579668.1 uncharacterized protein LOC115776208 [Archocentrus centrarchus]XP_030580810.1 uncharacterized protein LOC115777115 [Archocentrus centrarchus]XP_030581268.1 uncharacterized protein LOC115777490 [Archocentrus centrarchus]XP_030582915.1 uncharacterized protein LOC115778755 [Archocentrus centrarchus]XP_030582916.1 uncharacterized protein LOC115778755 [Archocentrus centrarchus]XP_030596036.1 uncharacterized protein LO